MVMNCLLCSCTLTQNSGGLPTREGQDGMSDSQLPSQTSSFSCGIRFIFLKEKLEMMCKTSYVNI